MSLAAGFHVKTSLPPGSEPALQAHARVYGQSSPVLLGKYDPATHSLRTFQGLLFEASTACLQTLPRWGWMHAGAVWGLTTSERPISANGSGYLPTPAAISYGTNQGGAAGRVGKIRPSLETMARREMWPTPDANDWKQDGLQTSQRRLDLYSTCSLNAAVRMWATPQAFDATDLQRSPEALTRAQKKGGCSNLREQVAGQLNPTWTAWLMGWPLDWEARGPLNPQTFRVWLQVSQIA